MALPTTSFVSFTAPVHVTLNSKLVNGSLPQLRQYGLMSGVAGVIAAPAIGVSKDGTVVRVGTEPQSPDLVPQIVKRAINPSTELEAAITEALANPHTG